MEGIEKYTIESSATVENQQALQQQLKEQEKEDKEAEKLEKYRRTQEEREKIKQDREDKKTSKKNIEYIIRSRYESMVREYMELMPHYFNTNTVPLPGAKSTEEQWKACYEMYIKPRLNKKNKVETVRNLFQSVLVFLEMVFPDETPPPFYPTDILPYKSLKGITSYIYTIGDPKDVNRLSIQEDVISLEREVAIEYGNIFEIGLKGRLVSTLARSIMSLPSYTEQRAMQENHAPQEEEEEEVEEGEIS